MNRINFARFLEDLRIDAAVYEDLARHEAIEPRYQDGKLLIDLVHDRLTPAAGEWMAGRPLKDAKDLITIWLAAQVVAQGPKVFQPTLEQCLAMEQVAPRIATTDYAQPYGVMFVEFPEAYRTLRACPAQSALYAGTHEPEGVLIGFHPPPLATICLEALFSSGIAVRLAVMSSDATIEDRIIEEFGEDSYVHAICLTVPERTVLAGVLRLAVNAMLLLTEFGCKRLGPANEGHVRRLERYVQVAKKRQKGLPQAQRNLRLATQLFGFSQNVVLHEEVGPRTGGGVGSDSPRRPLWRRGHWKMHAHGPGLSQRKRIFIKPALVNRHLLRGEGSLTTTYRIR